MLKSGQLERVEVSHTSSFFLIQVDHMLEITYKEISWKDSQNEDLECHHKLLVAFNLLQHFRSNMKINSKLLGPNFLNNRSDAFNETKGQIFLLQETLHTNTLCATNLVWKMLNRKKVLVCCSSKYTLETRICGDYNNIANRLQ